MARRLFATVLRSLHVQPTGGLRPHTRHCGVNARGRPRRRCVIDHELDNDDIATLQS